MCTCACVHHGLSGSFALITLYCTQVTPMKASSQWSLKSSSHDSSLRSLTLENPGALNNEVSIRENHQQSNFISGPETSSRESLMTSSNESLKALGHEDLKASSHESLKASSHESPKASSHESLKASSHESLKASSRESLKASSHESLKASSHESLKASSRHESLKASSHVSLKASSRESLKASSHESLKASSHESLKASSRESLKASSHESLKASSHESLKASSRESLKASSVNNLKASSHDDLKASSHEHLIAASHVSLKLSTSHDNLKVSSHESLIASSKETLKASSRESLNTSVRHKSKASGFEYQTAISATSPLQQDMKGSNINKSVTLGKLPENITPPKAASGIGQTDSTMKRGDRGIAIMQAVDVASEHMSKDEEQRFTVYTPCSPEPVSPSPSPEACKEPLERELAALQEALRAAGLPQLGSSVAGPHASTTGPQTCISGPHIGSTGPHSSSSICFRDQPKLGNVECLSVAGKGIALNLQDTIREITTQELASMMKEVLKEEKEVAILTDRVIAQDGAIRKPHSGWEWTTPPGHVTMDALQTTDDQSSHEAEGVEHLYGDRSRNTAQPTGRGIKRAVPVASKVGKAVRYISLEVGVMVGGVVMWWDDGGRGAVMVEGVVIMGLRLHRIF